MKTVIIVQARMTSTRLPGKVLKEVLGKPLLQYQVERLRQVKLADEIIIATTINMTDQPIVEFCEQFGIPYFRGSEKDVLSRYYYAAKDAHADVIVRITADCPVIDPQVIDKVVSYYYSHQADYDYVSNALTSTYPIGMDTEVFSYKVLHEAYCEAREQPDREHVTPFIYRQPDRYRLANVAYERNESFRRLTVDTIEDFELIKRIIEVLYPINPQFLLEDILEILQCNIEWSLINSKVKQKKYYE